VAGSTAAVRGGAAVGILPFPRWGIHLVNILRNAVLGATVLGVLPGAALAAPSVLGPNGYIFTPDGLTTPAWCAAVGYLHAEGNPQPIPRPGVPPRIVGQHPDVNALTLNVGFGNRLEMGLAHTDTGEPRFILRGPGAGKAAGGDNFLWNAKLSLLPPQN